MQSAKFAEKQHIYKPNNPVDRQGGEVNKGEEQATVEVFSDSPQESRVNHILCHVGEGDSVRYAKSAGMATEQGTIKLSCPSESPRISLLAI